MNPEAQRIAIAEACGWTIHRTQAGIFSNCGHRFSAPLGSSVFTGSHALLGYLDDLNAMHEAEKVLDAVTQRGDYWDYLFSLTGGEFEMCHATAAQRAEAFLRTLGKWEDDK